MPSRNRTRRGPGPAPVEKARDFGGAIKRLIHELKSFRVLIVIALFLAGSGSVLAIFTPNILSDLTDKIAEGLVPNTKNLQTITENITNELNEEKLYQNF